MRILFILIFISLGGQSSQDIAGSWIIQQQYNNGELVFSQPYLKYEFIPPHAWKSFMRNGYDKGPFDYEDGGTYIIQDGKIGLSYWNEDDVSWGDFYIQGDSLLAIELFWEKETAKIIFKRETKLLEL